MFFQRRRPPGNAVDMHCHILPGLDDGARDLTEALDMLRIATDEGITDVIATPHFHKRQYNATPEVVCRALETVQRAAMKMDIPVRLYPGSEVFYFDELPRYLREGRICTMNGTAHVLIEFSPQVMLRSLQNAMDAVLSAGFQPILAHAERYECLLRNAEDVGMLQELGVEIQINASAAWGNGGVTVKRFVRELLKNGWVDYIGTDAHDRKHRAPQMAACISALTRWYGRTYADALAGGRARRLLLEP